MQRRIKKNFVKKEKNIEQKKISEFAMHHLCPHKVVEILS